MTSHGVRLDRVARLVGDPSRAAILSALMDGRAWTGRELALAAHVVPSTASAHLQQLVDGELLSVVAQGRHRYYAIASDDVARTLEALMVLAPSERPRHGAARAAVDDLRTARTCYDHLAGRLGVAIADALVRSSAVAFADGAGTLTPHGAEVFTRLGAAVEPHAARRPLCRPCLDWSERRTHLAGQAGAALAKVLFEREWVQRRAGSRALAITKRGARGFRETFGIEIPSVTPDDHL